MQTKGVILSVFRIPIKIMMGNKKYALQENSFLLQSNMKM